jgi:hypothetical protein
MGKAIQLLQFWAIISLGLRADWDPETAKPARRARVREQNAVEMLRRDRD